jgi:hypothetical protein
VLARVDSTGDGKQLHISTTSHFFSSIGYLFCLHSSFRTQETEESEESTGVVMQGETAALEAETIRAVERLKEETSKAEKGGKTDPKKSSNSGKDDKTEEKAAPAKEKEVVDPEKEDPAGPSSF